MSSSARRLSETRARETRGKCYPSIFFFIKWRGCLEPFACFRLRASTRTRRARFEAPSRLARMLYAVCEFSIFFLSLSWFGHTQASKSVTPRGGEPEGPRARKRSRICIIGRALGRNRALARSSRPGGSRATPWRRAREIDARKRPDREKTLEGVLSSRLARARPGHRAHVRPHAKSRPSGSLHILLI